MLPEPNNAFVTVNDIRLHYRDWGGNGHPVVLLHGLASTSHIWDLVAPLLARKFRVVALDQRGHGLSDKPDNGYTFEAIVADLRAFNDTLEFERPVVVGHSWGGNVVLAYGASFPGEPRGIVLHDGGTLDVQARLTWEEARVQLAPPPLAGMLLEDFKARIRNWMPEDVYSPEVEAIVLRNFGVDDDNCIYPHLSRENHLKILRALWEQRPRDLYERIACPTLVLPARRDGYDDPERLAAKEEEVARAATLIPDVEVFWFEDTVHDVPLHRPRALADTLTAFIDRL